MNIEEKFQKRFHCPKCGGTGAVTRPLAMTGTGLSRLFNMQMYKYLFVSCSSCGYTEIYNLKILEGKGFGAVDVLDILFGS